MVSGKHKSNTLRSVSRKTPGGRTTTHYKKRINKKARCGGCGRTLSGTLSSSKSVVKNTAKTKKRPERPYGGVLCSRCMRRVIINKTKDEK